MSFLTQPGFPKVWYEERPGSQRFSFVGNVPKLTREFRCSWQDRWRFIRGLMGTATLTGINTVLPFVSRRIPHGYQDFGAVADDRPILYCTSIDDIDGRGPTNGEFLVGPVRKGVKKTSPRGNDPALYKEAFVRATYEAPTFHVAADGEAKVPFVLHAEGAPPAIKPFDGDYRRYVTKIVQPAIEVLRLPVGFLSWAEGIEINGVVEYERGLAGQNVTGSFKIRAMADITYVWHQVPALPKTGWFVEDVDSFGNKVNPETIGAVYTHLGCVNHDWFDGHPPGTLLLKGAEAKPYRWLDGQRYYDYTYHMQYFNPIDKLDPGVVIRDRPPGTFAGHNYFVRQFAQKKQLLPTPHIVFEPPHFLLLTHDGTRTGHPVFQYRDFNDLFIPFNRAHLMEYYSRNDLAP